MFDAITRMCDNYSLETYYTQENKIENNTRKICKTDIGKGN